MELNDSELEIIRDRVRNEAQAVAKISDYLDETFVLTARYLYGCQGKVFVAGSGTSGTVARRMAHLFSVSGTPSVFMQPMDALHGSLGAITDKDIVIVISKGGGSSEINDLALRCKGLGAGVVALTCTAGTPLCEIADISVVTPFAPDADMGGVLAMGSTLAHGAWGDAMACLLMHARGYSWQTVLYSHPGGAVGARTDTPDEVSRIKLTPLTRSELENTCNK